MRAAAIEDLRCPVSGGKLTLDESILPAISTDAFFGQEIQEALLSCEESETRYPILAGVAILVPDPLTYIANRYSKIFSRVAENVSPAMVKYLRDNAVDLMGNEQSESYWTAARGMSLYTFAHYDELSTSLTDLPEDHLLRKLIGKDYEDWYGRLLKPFDRHTLSNTRALDIACNVGGLVYRLSALSTFTYGIDFSFIAVLTARSILLGQPYAQDTYRLHIEGAIYDEKPLSVQRPSNVELVVASALNIPFQKESFDVVTCANLIDVMPQPNKLLINIHSIMRNGAIMVITDPYDWGTDHAGLEEWVGGRRGESSAKAMRAAIEDNFVIIEEQDKVPWILRVHERNYAIYLNHQIVAQKIDNQL